MTIRWRAQTLRGDAIELTLPLVQDEIDRMRQEYLDMSRHIPDRDEFSGENFYDFGHYNRMIDVDLAGKYQAWVTAINERERQNLPDLTVADFELNSGYRNPHHNDYHAGSLAPHSLHQYGRALDVNGRDVDGLPGIDRQDMANASKAANPPAIFTDTYQTPGHVHADWRELPLILQIRDSDIQSLSMKSPNCHSVHSLAVCS